MVEFQATEVEPDEVLKDGRLDLYPSLHGKGYVEVRIGTKAVKIEARGFIGLIPINDRLTLEVIPRVPLVNLSRLLEVSRQTPLALVNAIRLYEAGEDMYPSLAAVYATGLRQAIEHVVGQGLLKEYERADELTSNPRGRININQTMQKALSRGITHRADVSYFHRTIDNPVNRCLLMAVWRLSQYVDQIQEFLTVRARHNICLDLNASWHALQGVYLDTSESFLDDGLVTGRQPLPTLRSYYRSALDLALTIIGRRAVLVEKEGTHIELPSLVVNMTSVFEAYIRNVLAAASHARNWTASVHDGNTDPPVGGSGFLFGAGEVVVRATPDVVVRRGIGAGATYPLLVEVKYKPAVGLPKRDDLNQTIAYGAAYRAPVVVVAQPRAAQSPRASGLHFLGTIVGMQVHQYVMDLSSDLYAEEKRLADELGAVGALSL